MNINAAMYSSGNGEVGKALQKIFSMAYNMCHRSNKVTEGVVILRSHTSTLNAGPTFMRSGIKVTEQIIPTAE
jgi:hypothetical protein